VERLDVYDYAGQRTGKTIDRSEENQLREGEFFLIVHVCVFDTKGRLLIQQRHKPGDARDGAWDVTVAGHVHSGETSQCAAMREAREELGIQVDLKKKAPLMRLTFDHGFDDIYVVIEDIPVETLCLQTSEVLDARYADRDEILSMLHDDAFLPYMDSFIMALFDMRDSNGFIRPGADV
jgi:isopentenyldiphosphate isomerase